MHLILARHGNTFNKGEKTYRVGSRNDLPLVQFGLEQAQVFAGALLEKNISPAAVYCGPLQRTREFAQIIADRLNLPSQPIVDERLDELDYGAWASLTDEEVKAKFGGDFDSWEKYGKWPKGSNWPESEKDVMHKVKSFVKDLCKKYQSDDIVLAVSSNGRLRYFLKLIENEFESRIRDGQVKVSTGKACVIACDSNRFELIAWNISPTEL